ncbi:MAG: hypothetical protein IKV07_01730 [Bacteroidaceae bacterium]|nr:hypothetical protein [Bacteroidaceae bacterium]
MEFRRKIESIMTDANLTEDDKNLLMEVLIPRVLSYDALNNDGDERISEIVKKIEQSGLYTEFYDLLESKSRHYGDTAEDMINDGISSCG